MIMMTLLFDEASTKHYIEGSEKWSVWMIYELTDSSKAAYLFEGWQETLIYLLEAKKSILKLAEEWLF